MALKPVFASPSDAVKDIADGAIVLVGGFGGAGIPYTLLDALASAGTRELTCVSNNCGDLDEGLAALIAAGQVRKMVASFPRYPTSYEFIKAFEAGRIELELVPQGTLAERIRAGGSGIGAFFVRTGVGTSVAEGRETRDFDGATYLLESPIKGDVALIHAHRADPFGNLTYQFAQRNFNPIMATAARLTIAEVDELLDEPIDPEVIVTPGIHVDRLVLSRSAGHNPALKIVASNDVELASQRSRGLGRAALARLIAQDIPSDAYVVLGIGMPTLVGSELAESRGITIQSENGIIGMGPYADANLAQGNLVNANREAVTLRAGGAFCHHADSFAMIRGGHVDIALLGAYQVSEGGDLANWSVPADPLGSIGGAMDLAVGAGAVWVMMDHTTRSGAPKILRACSYPLTGKRCVRRIYTDCAVLDVTPGGLILREIADGYTIDEIRAITGAPFTPHREIQPMEV